MRIVTKRLSFKTDGHNDIIDLTDRIRGELAEAALSEGTATVFAIGSTAAITTVEFEPGLVKTDLPKLMEEIAPYDRPYAHHQTWGDDNGAAHLRSSLVGSSLSIPFVDGTLMLGTWQQIVLLDFDTRPRSRQVAIQFMGS
jgi:secondary thiamine-phosphate synthase enzyme